MSLLGVLNLLNIISSTQFKEPKDLDVIFSHTDMMMHPYKNIDPYYVLRGKVIGLLFLEKSTRTQSAFEIAAKKMGGLTYALNQDSSSIGKGESLNDTCMILSQYVDLLVLRHRDHEFITNLKLNIPIINAGSTEHPTQAITDLYTIKKETGKIHGTKILLVGDLKYNRSIVSLLHFLKMYMHIRVYLLSPPELSLPKEYFYDNIIFVEETDIRKILPKVDVVYMTRPQKELYPDGLYESIQNKYILDEKSLDLLSKDAIIMHPLPRNEEIPVMIDSDKRAVYFKQAKYGLYTKMAILREILHESN